MNYLATHILAADPAAPAETRGGETPAGGSEKPAGGPASGGPGPGIAPAVPFPAGRPGRTAGTAGGYPLPGGGPGGYASGPAAADGAGG